MEMLRHTLHKNNTVLLLHPVLDRDKWANLSVQKLKTDQDFQTSVSIILSTSIVLQLHNSIFHWKTSANVEGLTLQMLLCVVFTFGCRAIEFSFIPVGLHLVVSQEKFRLLANTFLLIKWLFQFWCWARYLSSQVKIYSSLNW